MASALSKMGGALGLVVPVFAPLAIGSVGYAAWRTNWPVLVQSFLTGPGRTSRILLLLFVIFNWKNMPFAWTYRVFYSIFLHNVLRKSPRLPPRALFKPMISQTHAPLLEIDYNLHKSNSTYFSDLDVSRSHLVSYLCRPAMRALARNGSSSLVLDPMSGKPARGSLGIILGAVSCSFSREIPAYKSYEMWSRVLCWDRKWFFIVTHFVQRGAAVPTGWLDPALAKAKTRGKGDAEAGWEKKIYATAISKYVFKVGRLTVHPAVVLESSGLLPERPSGWTSGENQVGDDAADVSDIDPSVEGEWDWRRIEAQRRKGMELASQFQSLDEAQGVFDGGSNGALARFSSG